MTDRSCGAHDCVNQCDGDHTHETCPRAVARRLCDSERTLDDERRRHDIARAADICWTVAVDDDDRAHVERLRAMST